MVINLSAWLVRVGLGFLSDLSFKVLHRMALQMLPTTRHLITGINQIYSHCNELDKVSLDCCELSNSNTHVGEEELYDHNVINKNIQASKGSQARDCRPRQLS